MKSWDEFVAWENSSRDTIDFKKIYVDVAGELLAGLLLSQIIFWYLPGKNNGNSKLGVSKNGQECLVKRREDWREEIRMTPRQVDRAIARLRGKGLIRTEVHRFNGNPTTHIFLLKDVVRKRIDALFSPNGENSSHQTVKTNSPNGEILNRDYSQRLHRERSRSAHSADRLSRFLLSPPFSLSVKKVETLLKTREPPERIVEVAEWWEQNYHGKGKRGDPFALMYRALIEGWDVTENPYYKWGLDQAIEAGTP